MEPQNKSSIGSIIGTIVIIAIIILGGLYFWGKRVEDSKLRQNMVTDNTDQTTQMDEAATIKSTSSSDDLDSIDADLNATNLDNLGSEMNVQAQ
jgi:FtsZ-interacting cell division protein ZipA